MSFKQMLKMKLPFTRKGLEDHLGEIQRQQAEELFTQLKEEMNLQFHRRINDLQQEMELQTEALFDRIKEEMNLQFHRRINDLQIAVKKEVNSLQPEQLLSRFRQDLDAQLDQRFNYLCWMLYGVKMSRRTQPEYQVLYKKNSYAHKVSVILSVRNGQSLEQSLASIREQTLGEIETILVDAGTGSKVREAATACIEENPDMDIMYLYLKEGGMCDARNVAFQEMSGEYIVFLEEGDTLPPGACQVMHYTAQHMACDIVIGSCMRKEGETRWYEVPYLKQLCVQSEGQNCAGQCEIAIYDPTVWGKLYRRKFLGEHELCFSNDDPGMDMIFNLNAICSAKKVYTVDTVTYVHYWGMRE